MRKTEASSKRRLALNPISKSIALALGALVVAAPAAAMELDTGNPDFTLRWDNNFRYNIGVRTDSIDPKIGGSTTYDASDYKFERGDIITNRLDVLSELEGEFNKQFGFRVSAAAWYDQAYNDTKEARNPALAVTNSYVGGEYSDFTKRWYNGPSGEFLDAFVYANVDVAGRPLSVKLGKHSVYWGNATFTSGGISYSQQPTDGRKGASVPGVETRETFLPLNQISGTYQVTDEVQLAGQYFFDWDFVRLPDGGTYFGGSDGSGVGPNASQLLVKGPSSKSGNWGLATRITPISWNGTTVGLYYREFDEKNGLWQFRSSATSTKDTPSRTYLVFPEDTKIIGASLDATLGATSIGAEVVLRKNAGLNAGSLGLAAAGLADVTQGPRGDVWHTSIGAVRSMPSSTWYSSGSITAEFTYDRLSKVTKNGQLFNYIDTSYGKNPAATCPFGTQSGCATKSAYGFSLRVAPQWSQVFDGVDLTVPLFLQYGLKGNTPDFGGTSEGAANFSIGAEFDIDKKWNVNLVYADSFARIYKNANGTYTSSTSGWATTDRGRLTLTVKTSF